MELKTIILGLILASAGFAEESQPKLKIQYESAYGYTGIGIGPLVLPNVSVGYRIQKNSCGFDVGTNVATIGVINLLKTYANFLWYPVPSQNGQIYFGFGVSGGPWVFSKQIFDGSGFDNVHFVASGNVLVGRSFENSLGKRQFFQVDFLYPHYDFRHGNGKIPFATISYGFGF